MQKNFKKFKKVFKIVLKDNENHRILKKLKIYLIQWMKKK